MNNNFEKNNYSSVVKYNSNMKKYSLEHDPNGERRNIWKKALTNEVLQYSIPELLVKAKNEFGIDQLEVIKRVSDNINDRRERDQRDDEYTGMKYEPRYYDAEKLIRDRLVQEMDHQMHVKILQNSIKIKH